MFFCVQVSETKLGVLRDWMGMGKTVAGTGRVRVENLRGWGGDGNSG